MAAVAAEGMATTVKGVVARSALFRIFRLLSDDAAADQNSIRPLLTMTPVLPTQLFSPEISFGHFSPGMNYFHFDSYLHMKMQHP